MDCNLEAGFACLHCQKLFCLYHGREHHKKPYHIVGIVDDNTKLEIFQKNLSKSIKSEIKKQIHQITLNTCLVISNLQQLAQEKINSLKGAKNLEDLSLSNFGFENHLMYLAQVGIINQGIYYISDNQATNQTLNWKLKIEELEKLNENVRKLEISNSEKVKEYEKLCRKFRDIEYIRKWLNELENKTKGFNLMPLHEKVNACQEIWNLCFTPSTKQLILSNDQRYIFQCSFK